MDTQSIFNKIKQLYLKYNIYYLSFYDKCFSDPPGREGKRRLSTLLNLIIEFNKPIAFSCFFRAD